MKQKDITNTTRVAILDAANAVIVSKGVNALTLEAVARQAGVSKGGLLYHFPSKNFLIEGMIEYLVREFDAMLEGELIKNNGDWLSAYIRASFQENTKLDRVGSALFAAIASDPDLLKPLRNHYERWQEQAAASAGSPELGTIIRMAVDGLWLADLLNFASPTPDMRQKMLTALLKLADRESQ
jgi:AcrR family transcriptional regulator